jgi:uncharacterized membrane protein
MSPTFDPIVPWPAIALFGAVVMGLTLWAYRRRLRGSEGRWRWLALGLRVAAVVLCLAAAARPSLVVMQKVKQTAAIVFLLDDSSSMGIADEANGRTRFEAARKALDEGVAAVGKLGVKIDTKTFRFNERLHEFQPNDNTPPTGTATALGTALDAAVKETEGTKLVSIVVLSDGNNNAGPAPLQVASRLKTRGVPVLAVGYGKEGAGDASRDLIARDLVAGPLVFVKNEPAIRGTVVARGFPDKEIEVGLYVEDEKTPVATKRIKPKGGNAVIPITDLKWIPQRPGETKLTLKVKPVEGELVPTNNEISTYVTVQSGGLAVLYLAGPGTVWETKFLIRALDAAPEIQAKTVVLRQPVALDPTILPDEELAPGKYDVIILGDVPASFFTPLQLQAMRACVQRGAGLMMLGGRSSFGAGGWAGTPVADVLPTEIGPNDGQIEPPEGQGVQAVPNQTAMENYVVRLGPTVSDSLRIWTELPPIPGANRLGRPKATAQILATIGDGEPLMVAQDLPPGRVLAFGGETWPWARLSDLTQTAHKKFWRQAILWLAHKEDAGSNEVKLALDRRRVAVGQKLDLTITARDAKGEPITDARFQTTIEAVTPPGGGAAPKAEPVEVFNQGTEWRGSHFVTGKPGEYRVTTVGTRNGEEIGRASARFLAFQDDRELENPAADFALLRQLMEITGGAQLAKTRGQTTLTPEGLAAAIRSIDAETVTDTVRQKEVRLWDNWPFLLIFTALLTIEWWLRKRHGWV